MELGNEKQLYDKIEQNYQLLEKAKNKEEEIVLISYISGLYENIKNITGKDTQPQLGRLYKNVGQLKKYVKKIKLFDDKWNRQFTVYKKFHFQYTFPLVIYTENFLKQAKEEKIKKPRVEEIEFSKEEFHHTLLDFMKSLNLEDFCNNILETKSIYQAKYIKNPNARAYTIYNPITKQSDIFIKNFDYNIFSMIRLIHELGHAYYFERAGFNSKQYLNYTNSYYKEATSKLFERLFLDFMIENNIKKDVCKMQMIDFLDNNHAFLAFSFSYSLLDDDFLWGFRNDEKYQIKQVNKLSKFIQDKGIMKKVVYDFDKLDVKENYIYTYGDIFSMFLKKTVTEEGINSKKMEQFIDHSKNNFHEKYMKKNNMMPNNYLELYKEELKILKK